MCIVYSGDPVALALAYAISGGGGGSYGVGVGCLLGWGRKPTPHNAAQRETSLIRAHTQKAHYPLNQTRTHTIKPHVGIESVLPGSLRP